MKLYLAGNFTITDEVRHEVALKKLLKTNYNRLCTFYYPKAADVIIKNVKPNIKKLVEINEIDLTTKNHPALGENYDQEKSKNRKKSQSKKSIKSIKSVKRVKLKRRRNTA